MAWEKGKLSLTNNGLIIEGEKDVLWEASNNLAILFWSGVQRTDSKYWFTFMQKQTQENGDIEYVFISVGCNSKIKTNYWYNIFKE